ncbi:MAG: hypothetical protein GEU74_07925 [Nitriliruptorales bacterium]|nr:hypothetical protein [Nitriliruptorales bacterium]
MRRSTSTTTDDDTASTTGTPLRSGLPATAFATMVTAMSGSAATRPGRRTDRAPANPKLLMRSFRYRISRIGTRIVVATTITRLRIAPGTGGSETPRSMIPRIAGPTKYTAPARKRSDRSSSGVVYMVGHATGRRFAATRRGYSAAMSTGLRVSIIVIGDEILGGFVQDTNSGWLAERMQTLGFPLDRVTTVPDSFDAIDEALTAELGRGRPRLVLTSGGIGSTPDDVTFEAVARHLHMPLRLEPTINSRISSALTWTADQGMAVTSDHERSMRKMAMVPEGGYLLPGAPGFVPGVAVDIDGGLAAEGGATIVILPGVPGQLQRIFVDGVEPHLLAGRGRPQHVAEVSHPYPESTLSPVLDRLVAEYPDVHLGSYPGTECIVRLKGEKNRVEAAMELLSTYLDALNNDPAAARLAEAWRSRWR